MCEVKTRKDMEVEYMTLMMRDMENREKGKEEGIALGLELGLEQGVQILLTSF